jgi:hypothetical protein
MVPSYTDSTMATASISSLSSSDYKKLKYKWNLWAHLPQDADWTLKSYKKIFQFKYLEDTIAITESLPEGLVKNCMLFIMKDGISPMWEDPKNRNGGCFSYKVSNKNVIEVWRDLTFVLVGESISSNLPFVNSVTGITISPKKNFCIVKIWMTNCDHQNPQVVTTEVKNLIPQGCLFKKHTPEF